jgi:clan AA aspartic protease
MGITFVEGTVTGPEGKQCTLKFLVDSGATYSLLPPECWQAIGLEPRREMEFRLADGSAMRRKISECRLTLPQGETHTPVILGAAGDQPLLGVVTLENLGVIFNPFTRTLQPMQMLLV